MTSTYQMISRKAKLYKMAANTNTTTPSQRLKSALAALQLMFGPKAVMKGIKDANK
jgi:hypothetical protein